MDAAEGRSVQTMPSGRRRARRWGVIGVLTLTLTLVMSSCTLWVNRQVVVEAGTTGLYAYIGADPSSQIQDVYTAICQRNADCTSIIMTNFDLHAPDWIEEAWNDAWWGWYSQGEAMFRLNAIAYARWLSGGERNNCLVLVKPTIPWITPYGVIPYRWQTRELYKDGCILGSPIDPRANVRSMRLAVPQSPAKRQDLFCAPLERDVAGAEPAGSLARRLISAKLAGARTGGSSVASAVLAVAPQGVAAPARRLVQAIELGRAKRGVAALRTAKAKEAIGDVDAWAQAHC